MALLKAIVITVLAAGLIACSAGDPERDDGRPRPSSTSVVVPGGSVVAVDAATGQVGEPIAVGGDPLTLVIAGGRVWTLNFVDGSLSRIDPAAAEAEAVRVGVAVGMASDGDDVWVTHDGQRVSRLDGATGAVETSFGLDAGPIFALRDAGFVGVGHGSIWVTVPVLGQAAAAQSLWRVDAASSSVTARIPIGVDPRSPLGADDGMWVVSAGNGRLTRVDPRTNEGTDVATGPVPVALEAGGGSIWVAHEGAGSPVWRIDPTTRQSVATIPVRGVARALAFGSGRLWVATEDGLEAIDPATNSVTTRVRLTAGTAGKGPIGMAVDGGKVWVSVE